MKFLIIGLLFLTGNALAESTSSNKTVVVKENETVQLVNQKKENEHYETKSKVALNLKLGYSMLTAKDNDNESLVNIDLEARYAFHDKIAASFGFGKWTEVFSENVSNDSGALSHQMNLGLTFALSGSLIKRRHHYVNSDIKLLKQRNTFRLDTSRVEETLADPAFDGWRIFATVAEVGSARTSRPLYGGGIGVYHESLLSTGNNLMVGVKYDHFQNGALDANLTQLFVGIGFLP
jgi:hypothetical protein